MWRDRATLYADHMVFRTFLGYTAYDLLWSSWGDLTLT